MPDSAKPAPRKPSAQKTEDLLQEFTDDWERLRAQKNRPVGSIEQRILTNLAFVAGEHWVGARNRMLYTRQRTDPNKLQLVFNIVDKLLNKVLGRLSSIGGVFKAVPNRNTPQALNKSEVVDRLTRALDEKLGEPTLSWERCWWMAVGGVAFEHIPWIEDATVEPLPEFEKDGKTLIWVDTHTGEKVDEKTRNMALQSNEAPERFEPSQILLPAGEVGDEILNPLQVFLDASVKSIRDLPPDEAVYVVRIRTLGWIKANFPKLPADVEELLRGENDIRIISTAFETYGDPTGSVNLQDLVPTLTGSRGANDPPMALVIERYQAQSSIKPGGRYTVFIPKIAILSDEILPYPEIPIVDYHWHPVTTSFWTKDFISDLIPGQRFLNKRISQLGEQSNASLYANELLGPGIEPEDLQADVPHPIRGGVGDAGQKFVQRRDPPQLPSWYMPSIELILRLMTTHLAGGVDLNDNDSFPGQLRGPLAVPMLQEILDTQWGHLYQHIGERLSRVKQMRLNRVKQFYPPIRTLNYSDPNQKDEVLEFHSEQILRAGTDFNIRVERSSLLPEIRALREARITERLNGPLAHLYVDKRTGRLDVSKIASDLQFGDLGRESREAQYRKLAGELIKRLWVGEPLPEDLPLPHWEHTVIMDELEAAMNTTEFLGSSQQVRQGFVQFWNKSREFLVQAAQQRQEAVEGAQIRNAVAQASQQAAAQAAAMAIEEAQQIGQAAQQTQPSAQEDFQRAMLQAQQGQTGGPPRGNV